MSTLLLYGLLAIVVAGPIAGGLFWFDIHPFLAASAGLVWAAALVLIVHLARAHPGYETGDSWRDARWTSASVLVAIVGLNGPLILALPLETRTGIALVVGGVGLASYTAGMLTVLDRERGTDVAGTDDRESAPTADTG